MYVSMEMFYSPPNRLKSVTMFNVAITAQFIRLKYYSYVYTLIEIIFIQMYVISCKLVPLIFILHNPLNE